MNRPLSHARAGIPLAALSALVLAACSPAQAPPPTLPSVFVSTVRNDSGAHLRVLPGNLRPRVESELSFRAGGKVTARTVELGQAVRTGQVLARIDAEDYQLAVQAAAEQQRAAEVDATQAASDAARFKRLLTDGSVGAADAERQQARADAAGARLAQAQRQLELTRNRAGYAVLTAPFDGIVTALRFETGQMVAEGQPVLSLARPGELELQADVPEALAVGLKGWQASATIGNSPQAIALKLRELAPSAAAGSRTFRARYALGPLPADTQWRMGMTAELRLLQPGHTPSAELPVSALLATGIPVAASASSSGQTAAVWLVDSKTGAVQRAAVQLLSQSTDHVRVAGLPDGAQVVSVGAQKLIGGLKVQPMQRPLAATAGRGVTP
jgi:RND family efflux transporter MFP subunit